MTPLRFAVIGPGRAGRSLRLALERVGHTCVAELRRRDDIIAFDPAGADLVLITVPDGAIAGVASDLQVGDAVVCHISGATPLSVLERHPRRAALHPLVSLPDPEQGSDALVGAAFAVAASGPAAEAVVAGVVADLGGRRFTVDDDHRAAYHATATVAANHLVALCAHVERLAAGASVPAEVFWPLMAGALSNVIETGSAAALTGPIQRGDWDTVRAHLAAIDAGERELYRHLAVATARLAGRTLPADLELEPDAEPPT